MNDNLPTVMQVIKKCVRDSGIERVATIEYGDEQ